MKRVAFPLLMIGLLVFSGCRGLRELSRLADCEYKVNTLTNTTLAGVNVQRVKKFEDLRLTDAAIASQELIKGRLPLNFILNIEAKNPNKEQAAVGRLEWKAFIDNVEIATGIHPNRVVIPGNGGTAVIPLQVGCDVLQILSSNEKRNTLLNFGMNLADAGDKPTRVSIKIRPSIQIAKKTIASPTFFTLGYTFGNGK